MSWSVSSRGGPPWDLGQRLGRWLGSNPGGRQCRPRTERQFAAVGFLDDHGLFELLGVGGRTRFANRTLRAALVESARGAIRKRNSYLAAQYRRLVKRRGDKKAIVAVAHSILVIAYHVLRDSQSYRELGGDYFDRLNTDRLTRYHTKRLAALGYTVTLAKRAA